MASGDQITNADRTKEASKPSERHLLPVFLLFRSISLTCQVLHRSMCVYYMGHIRSFLL